MHPPQTLHTCRNKISSNNFVAKEKHRSMCWGQYVADQPLPNYLCTNRIRVGMHPRQTLHIMWTCLGWCFDAPQTGQIYHYLKRHDLFPHVAILQNWNKLFWILRMLDKLYYICIREINVILFWFWRGIHLCISLGRNTKSIKKS
jgi:hypothetical protein